MPKDVAVTEAFVARAREGRVIQDRVLDAQAAKPAIRNKQRSTAGKDWDKSRDPEGAGRAMKDYLATLDDTAFGAASDVTPKFVSPSDPATQVNK